MALSSPYPSITQTRRDISETVLLVIADHRKAVGASLLALRKSRGLSQEDAAALVGVTLKTWGDWERGKRDPYDGNWRKIGEGFEVDPAEIRGSPPAVLGLGGEPPTRVDHLDARVERVEQSVTDVRDEFRDHVQGMNVKLDTIKVDQASMQDLIDKQNENLTKQTQVLENIVASQSAITAALVNLPTVANALEGLLQQLKSAGQTQRREGGGA